LTPGQDENVLSNVPFDSSLNNEIPSPFPAATPGVKSGLENMTATIGYIIVVLSVFGGFALAGGHLLLIFEPWQEWIIIAGAALGGLIVKTSKRTLKLVVQKSLAVFTGKLPDRETYNEMLKLIHELAAVSRRDGLLALEPHIQEPGSSPVFAEFKRVMARPQLTRFLCDNLKIVVIGGVNIADIEMLIDEDIEAIQEEMAAPQQLIAGTADALPGLGIVAAVLGIIKTMASIAEGPEVVGLKVAGALVGTFLGVLLCYGFVGPLATNLEYANQEEQRLLMMAKAGVMAIIRGLNPKLAAEYARRSIYDGQRPSFEELEQTLKG
jgi:chemotaxis protein MotA